MVHMVTLQKNIAYTYRNKKGNERTHYKYVVNLPENVIEKLGWQPGEQLEAIAKDGKLIFLNKNRERNKI